MMKHTPMQGPYDDIACRECTADLISDLRWDYEPERQECDPPYIAYPCIYINPKEVSNA